jgi:hypothetical protein
VANNTSRISEIPMCKGNGFGTLKPLYRLGQAVPEGGTEALGTQMTAILTKGVNDARAAKTDHAALRGRAGRNPITEQYVDKEERVIPLRSGTDQK